MNFRNYTRSAGIALLAIVLGAVTPAYASPCTDIIDYHPFDADTWASGDDYYAPFWGDSQVNNWWSAYAMEGGDWDEGWGYSDYTNVNLPLARVFNAMYLVQYSAPPGAGPENFLTFSHDWVVNSIDEIQTSCDSPLTPNLPSAHTHWGWQDDWTRLFYPFFGDDVAGRASTLIHEARHTSGIDHNAGSNCERGKSCDSSWTYTGANYHQVLWLWWFAYTAITADHIRDAARLRANYILQQGFTTFPGFQI